MQLRLLMETQHRLEIGQRIRELRENSTETNRSIADYCDVGERSVAAWVAGDGISYKNAKKVADLFEVSIDWLWRGADRAATPDVMGDLDEPGVSERLTRIEGRLDALVDLLRETTTTDLERDEADAAERSAPSEKRSAPAANGSQTGEAEQP